MEILLLLMLFVFFAMLMNVLLGPKPTISPCPPHKWRDTPVLNARGEKAGDTLYCDQCKKTVSQINNPEI